MFTIPRPACVVATATLIIAPLVAERPPLDGNPAGSEFTGWSEPLTLGPIVNTGHEEFGGSVSRDGLSLYFHSSRPGGWGGSDLWVARRPSPDDPWGGAENLGPSVNTEHNENVPRLSLDGHRLYFASDRPGGFGGSDLYVSRRRGKDDDFGWGFPENLGAGVNGAFNEGGPAPFEDDASGALTLFFGSNRPGGIGGADIYTSMLGPDETFGPAALVEELSSPAVDIVPCIRRDGLEMLITSNRAGSVPFPPPFSGRSLDLWVATRAGTADPWSTPVNLGPFINTEFNEGWPALSFDAMTMYFSAIEATGDGLDLYVAERRRLTDRVLRSGGR